MLAVILNTIPGWLYLTSGITSVVAAISARDLSKKRKALSNAKKQRLHTQVLRARLFSQEDGKTVEYNDLLKKEEDNYRLVIETINNGKSKVVTDTLKSSLDEIAEYLRRETKFILADFKQ